MINLSKSTFCVMLLMLLGAVSAWAQNAPTVQWQTSVPEVQGATGFAHIANATNGEYQTTIGRTGNNPALVRLTANGQYKETRTLSGISDSFGVSQLMSTKDGGYLATGIAVKSGDDPRIYLAKLDAQANTVWNNVPQSTPSTGLPLTYGRIFLFEHLTNFNVLTNYQFRTAGGASRRVYTKDGTEINYRRTNLDGLLGASQQATVNDVCEAVDGGTIVAFKIANNTMLWKYTEADSSYRIIESLAPINASSISIEAITPTAARDGYYIAILNYTTSDNNTQLAKISANGTVLWRVNVPTIVKVFDPIKLVTDPDGVVIAGNKGDKVVLQKFDNAGNYKWATEVIGGAISSFIKTPDGGYAAGISGPLFIKFSPQQTTPPAGTFVLTSPSYDCNTGQLTLNTSGGNGSTIEYRIIGLRDWAASNSFSVPSYQRNGTTFTLEARQSEQVVSLGFTTSCGTTTTPPSTTSTQPTIPGNTFSVGVAGYDCNTGVLSAVVNNPNGPVEYRIIGLRDWSGGNNFIVPSYQRNGTTFKVEARTIFGAYTSTDFTTTCGTVTPPVTPPTNPTTGTALSFGQSALYCDTGLLRLITSGGDGTLIEYRVPGLRDWGSTTDFTIPTYQRNGTTFTLYARQSGREITTTLTTACANARVASPESGRSWGVSVLGNPVDDQVQVQLSGLAGKTVQLQLVDLTGHAVSSRQVQIQAEGQTEALGLRGSAGVYLLRVVNDGQKQTVKVLKK